MTFKQIVIFGVFVAIGGYVGIKLQGIGREHQEIQRLADEYQAQRDAEFYEYWYGDDE